MNDERAGELGRELKKVLCANLINRAVWFYSLQIPCIKLTYRQYLDLLHISQVDHTKDELVIAKLAGVW